jgi:hypothetical protein
VAEPRPDPSLNGILDSTGELGVVGVVGALLLRRDQARTALPLEHISAMSTLARWRQHPLLLGLASLAIALAVTFLPLGIDALRARKRATPIEVLASPGAVTDSTDSTDSPTTTTRTRAK